MILERSCTKRYLFLLAAVQNKAHKICAHHPYLQIELTVSRLSIGRSSVSTFTSIKVKDLLLADGACWARLGSLHNVSGLGCESGGEGSGTNHSRRGRKSFIGSGQNDGGCG